MQLNGRFRQLPQRVESVQDEERRLVAQLQESNDYQMIIRSEGWHRMVKWLEAEIERIRCVNESLDPVNPANHGIISFHNGLLKAYRAFIGRPAMVVENTKKSKIAQKLNDLRAKFSREG